MECYFGYLSDDHCLAHFSYSGQAWKAGTYFTDGYDSSLDYAFMQVDEAIGHKTGWFGLLAPERESKQEYLAGALEELAGYSDGILMTNYAGISAGKIYLEPLMSWKTDPNGHGVGSPLFDSYYNAVGVLTHQSKPAARRVTDEVLAMADSLSSSNPGHVPSAAYDPNDFSGATLEGRWKLVRTEVAGEDVTDPAYAVEYLFKDGRWKNRTGSDAEWSDGVPYHYSHGTLYKYDDSPEAALVTVSGDTLIFRKLIDRKEVFQRVDGTASEASTSVSAAAPAQAVSAASPADEPSGMTGRIVAVERELGLNGNGLSLLERIAQAESVLGISPAQDLPAADRLAALERELGLNDAEPAAPVVTAAPAPVVTAAPAPIITAAPAPIITAAPAPVVTATPVVTARPDYLPLPDFGDKKLTVRIPRQIVYPLTWGDAQRGQYFADYYNEGEFGNSPTLHLGNDRHADVVWTLYLSYWGGDYKTGECDTASMEVRTGSVDNDNPGPKITCNYSLENREFRKLDTISIQYAPWSVHVYFDADGAVENCYISYYDGKYLSDQCEVCYEKMGNAWKIKDGRADKSRSIRIDADGMLQLALSVVKVIHTDEVLTLWKP